jgi:oxygen-independent coproporphyrinogen-3 oxidase
LTAFGVYVHVPFCRERCDYCAFATYTDRDHLMERYADACVLEVQRVFGAGDLALPTSIFFGGGTPSRLHPDVLDPGCCGGEFNGYHRAAAGLWRV